MALFGDLGKAIGLDDVNTGDLLRCWHCWGLLVVRQARPSVLGSVV